MEQIDPKKLVENAEKASRLLKIMSHPSRLMVLCYLMNGERPVSALNEAIPLVSRPCPSIWRDCVQAGLVDTRRESQAIHYRLNSKAVSRILEALYRIYCIPNNKEQRL
jgi:DNA-binding transcriptional ArsR family regulator